MKKFLRHNGIWVLIVALLLTAAISVGSVFIPNLTGPAERVLGVLSGLLQEERRNRSNLLPCLLASLGSLTLVELVRVLARLFTGAGSIGTLVHIALFELIYSMLLALPAYILFRFVHRRFGSL